MADYVKTNDFVLHPSCDGVRGQVLWVEGETAYVCWETGYEPYTPHSVRDLEITTVLDLLIEGREVVYEFSSLSSRCPDCGLRLMPSKQRLTCSRCKTYFTAHGVQRV